MDGWVPLLSIFLNSPTPESEASLWLHQSFNASSSSNSPTITANSFISLITQPTAAATSSSTSSSDPNFQRVMWMETLPSFVQARILSFLAYEHHIFTSRDLIRLARNLVAGGKKVDFWVEKGAHNLLDKFPQSAHDLKSSNSSVNEEYFSLPTWLMGGEIDSRDDGSRMVLPWLPLPLEELKPEAVMSSSSGIQDAPVEMSQDEEHINVHAKEFDEIGGGNIDHTLGFGSLDPEIQKVATKLNKQLLNLEAASRPDELANEIRMFCHGRSRRDSLAILELIEPWKADDEFLTILLSHLLGRSEEEEDDGKDVVGWPSQVLCSTILPKLLVLEQPASRVLMTLTINYCKLYTRAAEHALLIPLLLRMEGINNPISDVITRLFKECLHPAHVAAFCQKLLCGSSNTRNYMCLKIHHPLLSAELVWSESTFGLFQNILNHNVHLTQDSIGCLVFKVKELADKFSRSIKFGNFLLCFVIKCLPQLKHHKLILSEAASCTNTLVTKSVLSKLASL